MATFGDEQVGRVLGGRYRLLAAVGSGASATVYLADDVQLRRRVAVKVLHPTLADDPTFLRRFRAEAQVAAGVNHPNILAVHDWGEDGRSAYLVTEWLGGGSLRSMLDRGRRLSPSQALLVGLETCRGLDVAHRRGLVHRDIKPANLLFGDDGRLRIADFGLARAVAEAAWTEPAGVVLGTARYASPEQAKGLPVDGRSDVYSLALTIVEAVTGKVPFAADTTVATLMSRIDKLLPVSAELGPLAPVVERAGRPDPGERYDAAGFGRALVAAAERLPRPEPLPLVPTRPVVASDRTLLGDDPQRTSPAVALAGASAVAVVAGTAAPPAVPIDPGLARPSGSPAPAPGPPTGPVPVTGNGRRTSGGAAAAPPPPFDHEAEPAPHRRRRIGPIIAGFVAVLLVAGAAGAFVWWQRQQVPSFPVPPLVGLEEGRAMNLIAPNGWSVTVDRQRNDDQPAGHVFAQSPTDGRLDQGAPFQLSVSDGPTFSTIPQLTGMPADQAKATLDSLKLVANVADQKFDETVPAGVVMSWSVGGAPLAPGSQVVKGQTVDLVLSKGPQPRSVPKVVGKTYDEAAAALTQLRLPPQRQPDQFSDTVKAGLVIAIDPPAGAQVPRDTPVNIVVSKGPDVVTVPPLAGLTLQAATDALTAAGLAPGQAAGPVTGTVLASDPASGQVVRRGTTVNLLLK